MRSRPSPATLLATAALAVAVGLPAGHAVASALTPHTVKKLAKKVADKEVARKAAGLSVAHAAGSSNADALGGVPPSGYLLKQPVTMSFPTSGWENTQPTPVTVYRMPLDTQLSVGTTGLQSFTYPIALPVQLGTGPVTLTSVRYCYQASPDVHLTNERVTQSTFESGPGTTVGPAITQSFDLTDSACRTIAVNRVLGAHDQVTFQVSANWHTSSATLHLGPVAATFTPS
jgi:hypothetical protein